MKNSLFKKISYSLIGLLLIMLITFGISGLWILNTNYLDTGYLEDQTLKYKYLAEDLSIQISAADSLMQKLENNNELTNLLINIHENETDALAVFESIELDIILESNSEIFSYENLILYTSNESAVINSNIRFISEETEYNDWYIRITQSRRKSVLYVENGEAFVLYKLALLDDIQNFTHVGVIKIDLSFFHHTQLDDYKILLSNVSSNSIVEVSGNRTLNLPLTDYFGISDSLYIENEMVLAYIVVTGTTATRWSLILVTPRINFFYDLIIYVLAILTVFIAIGYVIFYRIYFVKKISKSFDELSLEDIDNILSKQQPSKIDNLVHNMYSRLLFLVKQNQELDLINQKIEVEKNEAELKALLSQIDPHYIFNLLNSIHKRALKNNEIESAKMILLMSKQLRRSLEWKDPCVLIKDELDHIKSYIALQQYFSGYEHRFIYDIDNRILYEKVPKLVLQTLIENALKHGNPTANFVVKLDEVDDLIRFSVKNEVVGDVKETQSIIHKAITDNNLESNNQGVGLQNMTRRLRYYYGESYQISTRISKQNITIQLKFPKIFQEMKQ
jgi:two-component system, sensor histidine kinase YesM